MGRSWVIRLPCSWARRGLGCPAPRRRLRAAARKIETVGTFEFAADSLVNSFESLARAVNGAPDGFLETHAHLGKSTPDLGANASRPGFLAALVRQILLVKTRVRIFHGFRDIMGNLLVGTNV